MTIRLAAYLQSDSIVDGEGIRTVIWTQGCPHHCLGCHNPETWSDQGGALVDIEEVKEIMDNLEGQDGITFSGGDPFMQPKECAQLAKYAKKLGYNVWCYTGYDFETLLLLSKANKDIMTFLKEIDVLIDGKFILSKKSYNCIFRGSTNQRIIDVQKSLKAKKTITISKYDEEGAPSPRKRQEGIYI